MKIKLPPNTYLSRIEPFKSKGLETDTIYHKGVTGCGITTLAYKYFNKNAIIIEPNVPVIEDKVEEHNRKHRLDQQILGVYKGIDVDEITDYINGDVTYKKILTTPEGFVKVVKAFGENIEHMLDNYFILFDECERIITDVSYRGKIAAPIDWFFQFKHKAMVSATVLPFSDPRFIDFKHVYIEPAYEYSKPLTVISTNNVVESLRKHLDRLNSEQVLIFLNSTNTIYDIASRLDILDSCHVYCSKKSALTLNSKKLRHSFWDLDVKKLAPINFFTSRFFSAVDIKLPYNPDVIMITDVYMAAHSVLDPQTEVIQIAGRCRNGVKSLSHISNFSPSLESMNEVEAKSYLKGCLDTYQGFIKARNESTHRGVRDALNYAIEGSPFHGFYNDGALNTFMVDNFINEERVRGYYQHADALLLAYSNLSNHFTISHKAEEYPLTDEDRRKKHTGPTARQLRQIIANELYRITPRVDYFPFEDDDFTNFTRTQDRKITEAFDILGFERLEATGYSLTKIKTAVEVAKRASAIERMRSLVHAALHSGQTYPERDIKALLSEIKIRLNLNISTPATLIREFFEVRRTTINGVNVYVLGSKQEPPIP
jgi:hypothetical protein